MREHTAVRRQCVQQHDRMDTRLCLSVCVCACVQSSSTICLWKTTSGKAKNKENRVQKTNTKKRKKKKEKWAKHLYANWQNWAPLVFVDFQFYLLFPFALPLLSL